MAEVTLSVLDRLIQPEPGKTSERLLREYLQRDLEWLLNTRQIAEPVPDNLAVLKESVYNYGLPDLTSLSPDNHKDRLRLYKIIERAIAAFEPRLASVRVTALEDRTSGGRVLRFSVEAIHKRDPAPERVQFDVLQIGGGEYQVKRGA